MSSRRPLRALGLALAIVVASAARVVVAAPMPGERAATLERQIAEKTRAIEQLERRNADLQQAVDANPADAGANLAARQEIRQNTRYVASYKSEVSELERVLAQLRAAEAEAEGGASTAPKRRPSAPSGPSTTPRATPRAGEDAPPAAPLTATRTSQPVPPDPGALDAAQVHELMRSWALGRGGVPGGSARTTGAAPLALVIGALDWRLDWRELSVGAALGAVLGWGLPIALLAVLRRRRPQRGPVVGSVSRKWASLAGAAGTPSKQWSDLAAKASTPVRLAAGASAAMAGTLVFVLLASLGGFGASIGTPGLWGEAVGAVLALALAAAAVVTWRRRSLAAALGAFAVAVLAAAVPTGLALTSFGGPGAVAAGVLLALAAALQLPAITALWSLATPRAVGEARSVVAVAGALTGALVGLAGAALHLLAA